MDLEGQRQDYFGALEWVSGLMTADSGHAKIPVDGHVGSRPADS